MHIRTIIAAVIAGAVACLLHASFAMAQAQVIFRWVDGDGNLHVTDVLADVPEPYHSLYVAKLRELEERKQAQKQGKSAPVPASPPPRSSAEQPAGTRARVLPVPPAADEDQQVSIVEQRRMQRAHWKSLMAQWRLRLETAVEALREADDALAQARRNPVLRHTPRVKKQIEQLEQQRAAALQKVEEARTMLLDTLPKRAREEKVPPKWLE